MKKHIFVWLTALILLLTHSAYAELDSSELSDKSIGVQTDTVSDDSYTSLEELRQKRIGIPSGTNFDLLIRSAFPDAQLSYYNNQSDLLAALTAGKIDAFPSDEPVIRYIISQGYTGI